MVATVAAAVANVNNDIARHELDIYMVICSDLAGLPNSDVDTEAARTAFEQCLAELREGRWPK